MARPNRRAAVRALARFAAASCLVALTAPVSPAADTDADKAKEVAAAFLQALRDKKPEAALATTDVPFAYVVNGKPGIDKDSAALKKWLKGRVEGIKEDDVPVGVLGA